MEEITLPRIPTSKPDRAPRRPSVGGQVDIRSQDAFFRSIAAASGEAAELFETARLEKQNLFDKRAVSEFNIWSDNTKKKLLTELEGVSAEQSEQFLNDWLSNTKFEAPSSASPEVSEAISLNVREMKQGAIADAQVTISRKLQAEVEALANVEAESIIKNGGSVDDAMSAYEGIGWSDLRMQSIRKELEIGVLGREQDAAKSRYELAIMDQDVSGINESIELMRESGLVDSDDKANLLRAQAIDKMSKGIVADVAAAIDSARDSEEIDSILEESKGNGILSDKYKDILDKRARYRKNTVAREDFSLLGTQASLESGVISRMEKGEFFSDEEIDAMSIDPQSKELFKKVSRQFEPGFGPDSQEYKNFIKTVNETIADRDFFSQAGAGELQATQYDSIYQAIENSGFNTSAKMSALSSIMKIRAVDAREDKDLFGFFQIIETPEGTVRKVGAGEMNLSDGQIQMLKSASTDLYSKIALANGKIDAMRVGMTYTDLVDLVFEFQSEKNISRFKDLDPESKEYKELYNSAITSAIVDKQKKTSIQLLRDRILGLKDAQLGLREEITGVR